MWPGELHLDGVEVEKVLYHQPASCISAPCCHIGERTLGSRRSREGTIVGHCKGVAPPAGERT